jgi:hypothetical protein
MTLVSVQLCYCGCGRLLEACHGLPPRERRQRRPELDGLAEIHDASALFPSVRPRGAVFEAYAKQVAASLDPNDLHVPIEAVGHGMELLSEAEHRRIIDNWVSAYPDRWTSVCSAVGNRALVEHAFVASAVRGAISERRPVPRALVAPFESGNLRGSPVAALGLVFPPALIWNRDAAILLRGRGRQSPRISPRDFDRWLSLAGSFVEGEQVDRVRARARWLAGQLPVAGLPAASDTLRRGCEIVESSDLAASELAALSLVAYARTPPGRFVLPRGSASARFLGGRHRVDRQT